MRPIGLGLAALLFCATSAAGQPVMEPHPLGDVPPDDPRMESYSHGNYVLRVADFLWTAGLLAGIAFSGLGATLQRWAEAVTQSPNLKVGLYVVLFTLVMFAGSLPLALYSGFVREKSYGFANQSLAGWLGDWGKALAVTAVLQALFFIVVYAAIRGLGRNGWVAAACLAVVFLIVTLAAAPVFIAPLFNRFEPLKDATLRSDILALARSQGIPADEVYEMDASRQSSHNNAYVAGLLGTERIVLHDTLLRRFTPREIRAVMGHEMGHYVQNHIWRFVAFLTVFVFPGLYLVDRVSRRIIERRPALGIPALSEPSSLPVILLVLAMLVLLVSPALSAFSRMQERQADLFGLEATGDPAAAASVFLKFGRFDLSEYRVHPWIEALLFSHPSLERRVDRAREFARKRGITDDGPSVAP
ncbi:MAG TPA: M48 family metallopeptidase [Candidatus Polarisedimenticolia bacterium]|nr:M48 family metallopeptidase [Candidatus Polarisedimenticolia bacterium]